MLPRGFHGKIFFFSSVIRRKKSDSHARKITVGHGSPVQHQQAFVLLTALFWQILFWRKQFQELWRTPIINGPFPPLSFYKEISSKATWLPHHNLRFLRLHLQRNKTMKWPRGWPPRSDNWTPLLLLPGSRTKASVSSLGKLSCYLFHRIIMRYI